MGLGWPRLVAACVAAVAAAAGDDDDDRIMATCRPVIAGYYECLGIDVDDGHDFGGGDDDGDGGGDDDDDDDWGTPTNCADATATNSPFWAICDTHSANDYGATCETEWEAFVECYFEEVMLIYLALDCDFECDFRVVAGSLEVSGMSLGAAEAASQVFVAAVASAADVVQHGVVVAFDGDVSCWYRIAVASITTDAVFAAMSNLTTADFDAELAAAAANAGSTALFAAVKVESMGPVLLLDDEEIGAAPTSRAVGPLAVAAALVALLLS